MGKDALPGPCPVAIVDLDGVCLTVSDSSPVLSLGFLKIVHESSGYLGGYLLTNGWGRPLEFRLTSAVQPNRVQAVLYGDTLAEFIQAELIGKTLIEKCSSLPQLVVTNVPAALAVRNFVSMPVVAVMGEANQPPPFGCLTVETSRCRSTVVMLEKNAADRPLIENLLAKIDPAVDLNEPFQRIQDAMTEARKMGVMNRAA